MTPTPIAKGLYRRLTRFLRRLPYALLSQNVRVQGKPHTYQPVLMMGKGQIRFDSNVRIGVTSSPGFWSTNCCLESRSEGAAIRIGKTTWINNGFAAIAEKAEINSGANCLTGHDALILDSNFDDLNPGTRHGGGMVEVGNVEISDTVFIESRVTIRKNSVIGSGTVFAAGAVVAGRFPENCVIGGNPAVIIRRL